MLDYKENTVWVATLARVKAYVNDNIRAAEEVSTEIRARMEAE